MFKDVDTARTHVSTVTSVLAGLLLILLIPSWQLVQGQGFNNLHDFTGGLDGKWPASGVAIDRGGNLYGTNYAAGNYGNNCSVDGCGTVYKLSRRGTGWILTPLYDFVGGDDGWGPTIVNIGPDGSLYGTTAAGGGSSCGGSGCGTVFRLQPPVTICYATLCFWHETILHRFTGRDGGLPEGGLTFDSAGNIYGTTANGGDTACPTGCGVIYKLRQSGGTWTESVLYAFSGGVDGQAPISKVTFDAAGNLYGTTAWGGTADAGTVYKLTPSGLGWTKTVLYNFSGGADGHYPNGGLIFDEAGNLYGTTSAGGQGLGGTIYELSQMNGAWNFNLLYSFSGLDMFGAGPGADLTLHGGNLYGTTLEDGANGSGNVFQLTPSGGGWTYASLHDFGESELGSYTTVVFDSDGNLYGTAARGGSQQCPGGCGFVWRLTP